MKKIITAALISALILGASGCAAHKPEDRQTPDKTSIIEYESDTIAEPTPIYDNTAVVSAYKSGDASKLSEFDKAVYDAAIAGVNAFYREGMSDEEIVLAAHDYIVTLSTYDIDNLALIPKRSENSESPYGALINKRAICMGYTTSFQMFMDMLGVESIIVRGEAHDEEHAWNMVHIGENWYHVDCTWDDFVPDYEGRRAFHIYCMITDSSAEKEHKWNRESAPKAESDDLNYYRANNLYAESDEQVKNILTPAVESGFTDVEFAVPKQCDTPIPPIDGVSGYSIWKSELDTYDVAVVHIGLDE